MLHGDGNIYLIYYEYAQDRFCYVVMQRDIADAAQFNGAVPKGKYFDWETPYGYGGPLTDGTISEKTQDMFRKEITEYAVNQGIVSQFVRFHPLLNNHEIMPSVIETRYLRDTIFMDTASPELIMSNMDSKNRNMVRKAQKNGVTIVKKDITEFDDFISMYAETMSKNGAEAYYTFQREYFESLELMKDNAFILYAMYEDMPISGSIMYYNERYMHYHLSGSHTEYRKYSPSNLLLYEAACLASEMGIKQLHLGGGMAPEDSLFGFKKQFNKNGRLPFVVGRTIFSTNLYEKLLQIRAEVDATFDVNNGFMIQYRR
jgi:lipid II:glycine glycyltransferase (peptidoglycan interpeptide bridge formation enzyme)